MNLKNNKKLIILTSLFSLSVIFYFAINLYYDYRIESLLKEFNDTKPKYLSENKVTPENLKIIKELNFLIFEDLDNDGKSFKDKFYSHIDKINLFARNAKETEIAREALLASNYFFTDEKAIKIFKLSEEILENDNFMYIDNTNSDEDKWTSPYLTIILLYVNKIQYQYYTNDQSILETIKIIKSLSERIYYSDPQHLTFKIEAKLVRKFHLISKLFKIENKYNDEILAYIKNNSFISFDYFMPNYQIEIITKFLNDIPILDKDIKKYHDEAIAKDVVNVNDVVHIFLEFIIDIHKEPYDNYILNTMFSPRYDSYYDNWAMYNMENFHLTTILKHDFINYLEGCIKDYKFVKKINENKIPKDIFAQIQKKDCSISPLFFKSLNYHYSIRDIYESKKNIAEFEIYNYKVKNGKYPEKLSLVENITLSPITGEHFKAYNPIHGKIHNRLSYSYTESYLSAYYIYWFVKIAILAFYSLLLFVIIKCLKARIIQKQNEK